MEGRGIVKTAHCKISITADNIVMRGARQPASGDAIEDVLTVVARNDECDDMTCTTPEIHYSIVDIPKHYHPLRLFPAHIRENNREKRLYESGTYTMSRPDNNAVIAQRAEILVFAEDVTMLLTRCARGFDVLQIKMRASGVWKHIVDVRPDQHNRLEFTPVKPIVMAQLTPVPDAFAKFDQLGAEAHEQLKAKAREQNEQADSLPNTPIRK